MNVPHPLAALGEYIWHNNLLVFEISIEMHKPAISLTKLLHFLCTDLYFYFLSSPHVFVYFILHLPTLPTLPPSSLTLSSPPPFPPPFLLYIPFQTLLHVPLLSPYSLIHPLAVHAFCLDNNPFLPLTPLTLNLPPPPPQLTALNHAP